jgi:hypothetical protein
MDINEISGSVVDVAPDEMQANSSQYLLRTGGAFPALGIWEDS